MASVIFLNVTGESFVVSRSKVIVVLLRSRCRAACISAVSLTSYGMAIGRVDDLGECFIECFGDLKL